MKLALCSLVPFGAGLAIGGTITALPAAVAAGILATAFGLWAITWGNV